MGGSLVFGRLWCAKLAVPDSYGWRLVMLVQCLQWLVMLVILVMPLLATAAALLPSRPGRHSTVASSVLATRAPHQRQVAATTAATPAHRRSREWVPAAHLRLMSAAPARGAGLDALPVDTTGRSRAGPQQPCSYRQR